jgi:DNA (cytosine-5)-methyltransferase 1
LADASRPGQPRPYADGGDGAGEERDDVAGSGGPMGDPIRGGRRARIDGLPGQPQPHAPRPSEWPPAPNDADEWARVLAVRPDLAPAVEPEVRRVVDGMAGALALPRADQLRILGNGVVPAQAAFAFRILAERHGGLA